MRRRLLAAGMVVTIWSSACAPSLQAGPLIDWLFGGRRTPPAYPVGSPVPLGTAATQAPAYAAGYAAPGIRPPGYVVPGYPAPGYASGYAPFSGPTASATGYSPNMGVYYGSSLPTIGPSGAGYMAPAPGGITAATMPQPMSFVPNFNSSALRAPVTYYRPIMTTDPNTGAQVVTMAPCTSYQYLTQRVPTFGQSALYGSYQPPAIAPAPSTMPTYTLPSGGIPLAYSSPAPTIGTTVPMPSTTYSQPTITHSFPSTTFSQPSTTLGYGAYQGGSNYATAPLSSSSYYNGPSGGSAGTIYSTTVPGLTAPQAPHSPAPSYSVPASPPSSTYPPSSPYSSPQPVLPPSDPADTSPSLPYNGLRPQLRSILPNADTLGNESASVGAPIFDATPKSAPASVDFPSMTPIPAPEGLERPNWSNGLKRDQDMTALRPVTRAADYAGQSKKIHWASFEQEQTPVLKSRQAVQLADQYVQQPSAHAAASSNGLRPATNPASIRHYDNSGWKVSQ
ncbi:MAG: hypothetical protein KF752_16325 [Pirellulaceae bacterium]|nr:hypothetical protein [Pirellulaceae bacterium]